MKIIEKPIGWYISKLKNNDYFSFPGYGDAEWLCMINERPNEVTGAGQVMTPRLGKRLRDSLIEDKRFLPSAPKIINTFSQIGRINELVGDRTFYERDMVLDDLAEKAGLNPFIKQLREMSVVIVSRNELRGLRFLDYDHFIEMPPNNACLVPGLLDQKVQECLDYGKPAVYLFSVGFSSAIMISQLHNKLKDSFLVDTGSIWDAFVKIGVHREWRAKLYNDERSYKNWVAKNLGGIES